MELHRVDRPRARPANDTRAPDARIARALVAISARPAERWTVARLAKIAGMSRAAFARRFADDVGEPPLRFVARVRMERAARLLVAGDAALAAVAIEVGYANEFALSRAFRRMVGEPPSVFRRRARGAFTPACRAA